MKPKEFKKIHIIKSPYYIFTNVENDHQRKTINPKFPEFSKHLSRNNKKILINPLMTYKSTTSKVSSISRSLKKVALNSKLYGSYIDFYTNLTQKNY